MSDLTDCTIEELVEQRRTLIDRNHALLRENRRLRKYESAANRALTELGEISDSSGDGVLGDHPEFAADPIHLMGLIPETLRRIDRSLIARAIEILSEV